MRSGCSAYRIAWSCLAFDDLDDGGNSCVDVIDLFAFFVRFLCGLYDGIQLDLDLRPLQF